MRAKELGRYLIAPLLVLGSGISTLQAEEEAGIPAGTSVAAPSGRAGAFGLVGNAGYYTYGMNEVNDRFLNGRDGSFHGGMGYGAALKYCFSDRVAGRLGIDYLFASTDSSRTIAGTRYNSRVELPATLVLLGVEYVFVPLPVLNLKVMAGPTLVTIFNGREAGTNGNSLDMGSISGSGFGAQVGLGAELFLAPGFSLGTDLAYNHARIDGATFAGAPADPGSVSSNGTVDYSGLVAKLAFTIYFIP